MFGKLKYWREGLVTLIAVIFAALILLVFGDGTVGTYLAAAVLYTIIVFGWAFADRGSRLRSRHDNRSPWLILYVHLGCLAILLGFIYAAVQLKPSLPHWIVAQDQKGESWFSGFLLVGGFILEAIEQHWLSAKHKSP